MLCLNGTCTPFFHVFNFDEEYDENERKYEQIRKIILDKTGDDEYESNSNSADIDEENSEVDTAEGI